MLLRIVRVVLCNDPVSCGVSVRGVSQLTDYDRATEAIDVLGAQVTVIPAKELITMVN
jgi:hypothetical protein